jgi:hypothetical protein
MIFDWFKIFNYDEFESSGLVSEEVTLLLQGKGYIDFLISRGNEISVMYDGVLMPVVFSSKNPYIRAPYAVYRDEDGWVWLGFEVEE